MLTTILFSLLCAFAPTEVVSAASDTTTFYFIDYEKIDAADFNGSQLVGKKIVAYTVDTIKAVSVNDDLLIRQGEDRVIIMHHIETEEGPKQPDKMENHIIYLQNQEPLYVVDGVVVAAKEVKKMDMQTVESISIVKGPRAVGKYGPAATYGAVIIQTKNKAK